MKILSTYISIPIPCHENWDEMSMVDRGKYCNVCSKTVVDFSEMEDAEIIDYLNKNTGRVCGRFADAQLKPHRPLSHKLKVFLCALFSVFLLQISEVTFAQKTGDVITDSTSAWYTISGRVFDEKKQPLDFATVLVYDGNVLKGGGKTDLNGNYDIGNLAKGKNYTLKVNYITMKSVERNQIVLTRDLKIDIEMKKDSSTKVKKHIVGIIRYEDPLIDPSNPGKQIMRKADMKKMPVY